MIEDPVVKGIQRLRREHAARHGNDVDRICKALRLRGAGWKRKIVERGPRVLVPRTGSESS